VEFEKVGKFERRERCVSIERELKEGTI